MTLIHLDTDIGGDPDDVCALALLLAHPGADLLGITTVCEDGGRRAGYAREVLRLAGRTAVPVAAGASTGIQGPWRAQPGLPDERQYWGGPVLPAPGPVEDALALLDANVEAGATVVAIGPPTNLALYEARRPGRLATVPVVLMGGYIVPAAGSPMPDGFPQWGPNYDWNLDLDVPATELVLSVCRPTIVPVNATIRTALRASDLPRLEAAGDLGRLMARQAPLFLRELREGLTAHPGIADDLLNFHHAPLACAVALGWSGVTVEELRLCLEYEDGYPVERVAEDGAWYPVVTGVDGQSFGRWWLDVVTA